MMVCRRLLVLSLVLMLAGCTATQKQAPPTPGLTAQTPALAQVPTTPPAPAAVEAAVLYPAYVQEKGQPTWGYIDRTGRFVIAPAYAAADSFTAQGLAAVLRQGKWGLIDRTGRIVLEPAYEAVSAPTADGEWLFSSGETHTIVSAAGEILLSSAEITPYFAEGLVAFRRGGQYGYMDTRGAVVIEPQYRQPALFREGRAVLPVADGKYVVIDKTGKRLAEVAAAHVGEPSDGMLFFRDGSDRLGYLTVDGQVAVSPRFAQAGPFRDGFAVVNTARDYANREWGVINKQSEFVIAPTYGVIENLGAGLFAVAQPAEPWATSPFLKKAIFNRDGKQLTDFLYYDVLPADQGLISVSDETSTYFLDTTGAKAAGLPTVSGVGFLRPRGELIWADVDQASSYLTRDGRVVWEASRSVALSPAGRVEAVKQRRDRLTLIWYPQVTGLPNTRAQEQINADLKQAFLSQQPVPKPPAGEKRLEQSLSVGFTAEQMGSLLIVEENGYAFPMGAAHGMPLREHYHYDLGTGARYGLADLFKPGSPYAGRLTELVRKQIALHPEQYLNLYPDVTAGHRFTLGRGGLVVYFYPYDIAPYAAGFPSFTIPYGEIQDLINTEGPFWKALGQG